MQKYTIEWSEVFKEGSKEGRPWKMTKMTLKDEKGGTHEDVTTFDTVVTGATIEGEIVMNGNYKNFKAPQKPKNNFMANQKEKVINEAMDKKNQNIQAAQDRSAWMWAKTNASSLIASPAYMEKNLSIPELEERVLKLATLIYNGEPQTPF